MFGKAIKKVGSAVTKVAQSAPRPDPRTPTNPPQRFGGIGAGFRNKFGGGAGMAKALPIVKKISSLSKSVARPMMKKGGKVSSTSKRADGIAIRGKTRA